MVKECLSCRLLIFSGGDDVSLESRRDLNGLMQTDSTEADVSSACDGGFTQAWDTVGAGAIPTHV
jgi:hypothetical protein